jgi:hypothetical protein
MPTSRKTLASVAVFLLAAFGGLVIFWTWRGPDDSHFQGVSNFEGIEIRGDERFVRQVEHALALVRDKSPDSLEMIRQFVKRIQHERRTGMRAYDDPPTFDLADATAYYSVTWCAGAIAHDAYHSKLYHEYRVQHGEPVPDSAWTGQVREMECNRYQLGVLSDISAPEYEIEHMRHQDGSHFDQDGDGEATWKDYEKADW